MWFKNRRAKERKDAKIRNEEGQSNQIEKKGDDEGEEKEELKKDSSLEGEKAKTETCHHKNEAERKAEKQSKGEAQMVKCDANMRQKSVENRGEKCNLESKQRKLIDTTQKSPQTTPFNSKLCEVRNSVDVKADDCDYSSAIYQPRPMPQKHYSKSYLTHSGALYGMENAGHTVKQKLESERQALQESAPVLSGSSHLPMTRLSSAVLPHYSNYVHQSTHANTETVYDYPSSYTYRSFLQRHSSQ